MTKILGGGIAVVVAVELLVLAADRRSMLLLVTGIAVALVLLGFVLWLASTEDDAGQVESDSLAVEALRRWRSRTEIKLSWSEGSRGDWDRHLRPLLAREFSSSTGHRQTKDRAALVASGRVLFGPTLWQWVDPLNVSFADRDDPGPGRTALDEILERLEKL